MIADRTKASRLIVGIIGPKQSGKSTLTKYLVEHYGFTRTAFADPLKQALITAFGLTREQVYGNEKEIPTDKLCGRTPRHAMITMGTEWGRDMIHPDIWLTAWKNTLPPGNLVIEDVRFPNEHHEVTNVLGGSIISVQRPGCEYDSSHESEAHADLPWTYRISNNGEFALFKMRIDGVCEHLGVKPIADLEGRGI